MAQRLLKLRAGCEAHASGALWMPEQATLVIADAHLGYGWALRRRGQLGPVADITTPSRIAQACTELAPRRIVFLGDLVHAPRPGAAERENVEAVLRDLHERLELILVRGNHDRRFARDYSAAGVNVVEQYGLGGITAIHGDRVPAAAPFVAGHLHPVLGVLDDAGAVQRVPVFLSGPNGIVLPAFSPYSAGYDIRAGLPSALQGAIGQGALDVVAATGNRVVRVNTVVPRNS